MVAIRDIAIIGRFYQPVRGFLLLELLFALLLFTSTFTIIMQQQWSNNLAYAQARQRLQVLQTTRDQCEQILYDHKIPGDGMCHGYQMKFRTLPLNARIVESAAIAKTDKIQDFELVLVETSWKSCSGRQDKVELVSCNYKEGYGIFTH